MFTNKRFFTTKATVSSHQKIFYSGYATMFRDRFNANIYYPKNNMKGHKIRELKHMFTAIKLNGGYLIRLHTSKPFTYITPDITFKNIPYDGLIKHSNEMFYMRDDAFNDYLSVSYQMSGFPKTFQEKDSIKLELKNNLIHGYNHFINSNLYFNEADELISFSPNKGALIAKELGFGSIKANYEVKKNQIMLSSLLGIYPKNLSKIFIDKERIESEHFNSIHQEIQKGLGIEDKIVDN
jgi:hypothetical protein